ncbi:heme peroxidase [Sistotremastrum suecicum HHB10207 ss-3]|uniref:Heme peroxidase n=1 Tax=Sistotremastrum suecicum HHB10207 ss-3 TaxID=1314776 RepID=A0A166GE17_9AGAM|nr:heme peroxidase [Sistotremastrum suecicum HHB10207 ss-3]
MVSFASKSTTDPKKPVPQMSTAELEQIKQVIQQWLGTSIADMSLQQIIQEVYDEAMNTEESQRAITGAMLLLTTLAPVVPQEMVRPLNDRVVGVLYESMPRPPQNMARRDWRSLDGSDPLGKSNMPYARSVPVDESRTHECPDSREVFRKLMLRVRDKDGKEHAPPNPDGLSALTFAYGTLVIHSVFNSDHSEPDGKNIGVNKSSSFFDLSLLYGNNEAEVALIRHEALGRGTIQPNTFSDNRVLLLPPAASVILVLFNRNHNYIANRLLEENERGQWSNPPPLDKQARARQDEEIFQTARLINCLHFVNIVITDYVGGIMGVTKNQGGWPGNAEPLDEIEMNGRRVSRGDGNLISIEFNTLYRWHSTLSKPDVEWAEGVLSKVLERKDWDKLQPPDYQRAEKIARPDPDPRKRTFGGLERGEDGTFNDNELANLLYDAIEAPAGFFRAQGSPLVLGFVDPFSVDDALSVCTLNEFRRWLGLDPFKDFEDWNAYKPVADAARELYGDIEKLELYPGLHAEGHADDGYGLPYPPLRVHTMRNGLLFDAIALIRGDRFFTTARTPENLTQWGWNDIQRVYPSKAFGGHIHNLLRRLLPTHFPENSSYTWFPMSVPAFMEKVLTQDPTWDFTRPVETS